MQKPRDTHRGETMTPLSNKSSHRKASLPIIIFATVFGGIVGGIIYFAVSQVFYLIILSPFAIGLFAIGLSIISFRKARLSNKIIAGVFGIVLGLILYGTYQYAGYLQTKREATQFYQDTYDLEPGEARVAFDMVLQEETGSSGVLGYALLLAREGFSFTGYIAFEQMVVLETDDLTFQGPLAWLYWFAEFAIIAGCTIAGGLSAAGEAFIEAGLDQYRTRDQAGNIEMGDLDEFLEYLTSEQFERAINLIEFGEKTEHPTIEVYVQNPKKDSLSKGLLTVKRTSFDSKGRIRRENTFWQEISLDTLQLLKVPVDKNNG
jgi:hypothetical protein